MQDGNPKQLITDRIKNATNILVTVSRDPSVDELSAALGLTLMLNKLDKHATAVFSGQIPPAITFLEPNKTFENTVDSLRDFIIALDKEKADRLRYKVEDDVVRIFITPYRTTITDKDLQFSQGDFNVELIVALGVEKREDLDNAITAHGRILHDATVVTINAGATASSLGTIDWSDGNASSLCEMLMSLSEALQTGILDEQIASALLTGLVSATERFSNAHTSPRVMTMAAQLMAAGANQQLIATKLEEGQALPVVSEPAPKDGTKRLEEGSSEKVNKQAKKDAEPAPAVESAPAPKPDGEMDIEHDKPAPTNEPANLLPEPTTQETPAVDNEKSDDLKEAETELQASLKKSATPTLSVADLKKDLDEASKDLDEAAATPPSSAPDQISSEKGDWRNKPIEPTFGGTLNATANEAEEDKRREDESNRNHTILNHDQPVGGNVSTQNEHAVLNSSSMPDFEETPLNTAPFEDSSKTVHTAPLQPTHGQTLAELEDEAKHPTAPVAEAASNLDDARAAVDAALSSQPFDAAHQPLDSLGAQSFGSELHPEPEQPSQPFAPTSTPGFSTLPTQAAPTQPAASMAMPPLPPMPDFSTLPPLPPLPGEPMTSSPAQFSPQPSVAAPSPVPPMPSVLPLEDTTPLPPQVPVAPDPGQFKIPGQ